MISCGIRIRFMRGVDTMAVLPLSGVNRELLDKWYRSYRVVVAEVDEPIKQIIGFTAYRYQSDCLKVIGFNVSESIRDELVEEQLLEYLKKKSLGGPRRVVLEVSERDLPMHLLLRDNGFLATEVIGEVYQFEWEPEK